MTQEQRKVQGMLAVCREHLELAIDWFVDEMGLAPDLILAEEARALFPEWDVPEVCARCERPAEFVVCVSGE